MTSINKQRYSLRFFIISCLHCLFTFSLTVAQADGSGPYAFSGYDANKDGFLDKKEYEMFYEEKNKGFKYLEIWVFEQVDLDGNKKLSRKEMVKAIVQEIKKKYMERVLSQK